jgi:hypothetical protein
MAILTCDHNVCRVCTKMRTRTQRQIYGIEHVLAETIE